MQTLRRTVAVLIFPTIAWLGAACERTNTPTAVRPMALFGGPTCNVPADYLTIQAAVNDPGCSTIIVAPGTYPELAPGPLTINRTITLLGAQSGVDARNPRGAESIIADMQGTSVSASNVIIDGFTVENSIATAFTGFGIWLNPGISGTQILNNIIQDNIVGIGLANSGVSQGLIQHNLIQNNNVPGAASGTGIYTDEFVGGPTVKNVLIKENSFKGNVDAGIDVSNTDPAGGAFNLDVSTNLFDMNGRAVVLFNTHMSPIHDNRVTNSTFVGSAAIRLFDNNTSLSITSNNLVNGLGHAIRLSVLGLVGGPSSGVVINENNIGVVGSANFVLDGLLVSPGGHVGTVNAECNWWGSSTGPINASNPGGTGEEVVGDADFTPWLVAPAPGGGCAGGGPSGKVTGGGQVPVDLPSGKGSFGFNAKSDRGVGSGHLNYLNHATRAHLDCTVDAVLITFSPTKKAELSGTCSANSDASSFKAEVEDKANPGKGADTFKITYPNSMSGVTDGGTLISGNIVIHQ